MIYLVFVDNKTVFYKGTCEQVAKVKFKQAASKGMTVELFELRTKKEGTKAPS